MNPDDNQPNPQQTGDEHTSETNPLPAEPEHTDASSTQPQPMVTSTPMDNKPKKSKMLMIIIITILLLGGLAAAYFLFMKKDKATPSSNSNTQNSTTTSFESPKDTVTALSTKIKELVEAQGAFTVDDRTDGTSTGNVFVASDSKDYFAEATAPAGSNLYFMLTNKSGANAGNSTDDPTKEAALAADAKKFMEDNGFTSVDSVTYSSEVDDYTFNNFSKGTTYCSVSISGMSANAGCTDKTTADKAKTDMAPFAKILKDKKVTSFTTASLKIEDGKNGYKIATVFTNPPQKHILLQKSGSTTWEYFSVLSYQSISDCSVFEKNADAKMAYEGYDCLRNNANSTVKKN